MSIGESLHELRELHARAKGGALPSADVERYRTYRDELAGVILAAHRASVPPGQLPRRALRVARAVPVDVELGQETLRGVTVQLSSGGFGALLPSDGKPGVGQEARVSLRVPTGEPILAHARVVAAKDVAGASTVSFQFLRIEDSDVERVETFVFDSLLEHFRGV